MDNPLVQPDPGLFIWTILTFLVLLTLLAKFAWGPLLQALDSRQEAIRKSLDDAQQAKQELERLQQESAQIIRQARVEAEAIIAQSRSDAERLREEMQAEGEGRGRRHRQERRAADQLETARALQQIRHEAVDLSVMIASKIIQRNLSKEDNERLIDEALKQIEASVISRQSGLRGGKDCPSLILRDALRLSYNASLRVSLPPLPPFLPPTHRRCSPSLV